MAVWNPWHGCNKISAGCYNCYVYRLDKRYGRNPTEVKRTGSFYYPVAKNRKGEFKLQTHDPVYTCMTSDFFVPEADEWRSEVWDMMKSRPDLHFYVITKRVDRIKSSLPDDWGDGYDNLTICVTCENQKMTDHRLPEFLSLPLKHREIIHEPMLEKIDIRAYLDSHLIEKVIVGGESGSTARVFRYEWAMDTYYQCKEYNVPFFFKQTGALFYDEDGSLRTIARNKQVPLAQSYGINTCEMVLG